MAQCKECESEAGDSQQQPTSSNTAFLRSFPNFSTAGYAGWPAILSLVGISRLSWVGFESGGDSDVHGEGKAPDARIRMYLQSIGVEFSHPLLMIIALFALALYALSCRSTRWAFRFASSLIPVCCRKNAIASGASA